MFFKKPWQSFSVHTKSRCDVCVMCGPRGGRWSGPPPPLNNYKSIGFLSISGPDPLKNNKATEPAFNIGPSSARQRNAI